MKKIQKMALFLKKSFEKEKVSEEDFLITDIKNQINEKIKLIPIIINQTKKK